MGAGAARFVGVAEFVLNGDAESFRQLLTESVSLTLALFDRAQASDSVSASYLSLIRYQSVLDALAVGRFDLADRFATLLRGRESLDRSQVHKFDRMIAYSLLAVLGHDPNSADHTANFIDYCSAKGNQSYTGYAVALDAIRQRDSQLLLDGLNAIIKSHRRLASSGIFNLKADELLCVWGLAICNLARHKGLKLDFDHELIPATLMETV
ncbi:hypothetical protein RBSH_02046 [Rhodopirellula baltica SH28]|uniref:Uncharacterized protein n=1 Tax=Rhodopirellula baltica SH28 TaxID=993517 RepID=K5E9Z2_RHOBT|nr:hypothetical protein RBSH_02046 [Rhodopirellula baltica SH28]